MQKNVRRKLFLGMNKRLELIKRDIKLLILPAIIFLVYFVVGKRFLYSLCPSVVITGLPCPGCGLTRATFAFMRGDFLRAWELHPFIYILGIYVIVYCIRRYILLRDVRSMYKCLLVILIAMLIFYIYRMIRYFPGEAPMSYYYGSIFYRILQSFL